MNKKWIFIFLPLFIVACSLLGTNPTEPSAPVNVPIAEEESTVPAHEEPLAALPGLSPSAPWMLTATSSGIYIRDENGANPIQVPEADGFTNVNLYQSTQGEQVTNITIAPRGGKVAIVKVNDKANFSGLNLHILSLPSGKIEFITPIIATGIDTLAGYDYEDIARKIAIGSPAWSPDGNKLAFLAALESPALDLYLYDLNSRELTRLTQGTDPLYGLSWAPDGNHLLFWNAAGYDRTVGVAEANSNAGEPHMYTGLFPDATASFLGWRDANTYLFYAWSTLGADNLRAFNIVTGKSEALWDGNLTTASFDPKSRTTAICLIPDEAEYYGQTNGGLYLLGASDSAPRKVFDNCGADLEWHPIAEVFSFTASNEDKNYLLTIDGLISGTELDELPIHTSTNGAWQYKISVRDENGNINFYKLSDEGLWEIYYFGGTDKILWQPDGQRIFVQENEALHAIHLMKINMLEFIEDVHYVGWVLE